MLINPRINQPVIIWYRPSLRHLPYHGQSGRVVIRSRGKPRNHGVAIGGRVVVVPCGNLQKSSGAGLLMGR